MKFKNFFLSCSTSGDRSRKVEEKQQKYNGLRPVSPPRPPPPVTTIHPVVAADLRQDYYSGPAKKNLTNSYSSYSCGSASSHSSSKSGSCSGGSTGTYSISKNKRTLDSRSGRHRSERQKKCTSRQCCIEKEFNKFTMTDYDVSPTPSDDLGVKVGDRVVWLREQLPSESGVVRWIGVIEAEEIAGIEFDRPLGLGSGWYKNRQLFTCDPQCGGLVAVAGLILEDDFFNPPSPSPSPSSSSSSSYRNQTAVTECGDGHFNLSIGEYQKGIMPVPYIAQPLREEDGERINGRLKGIQGHRNSCYLDATLFAMFSFSSVFDSILLQDCRHRQTRKEDEDLARMVQKILRDDIVNPLRKELYCKASNVMTLRQTMEPLDGKLTCQEMDPQEFLQLLFDKVLNLEEFMSLSSGQSDFFHQVLVQQTNEDGRKIPSIQQLFEQSLLLQNLKLKRVPQPALILQMPRSGNKYKMYEGILPNLTIDITDLLEDIPRMCIICGALATYECAQCYGKFNSGGELRDNSVGSPVGSGEESTAFCDTCVNQIHKRKDRQSHMQTVVPIKYSFPANQYFPNANNASFLSSSSVNPSSYFFGQPQIGVWGNPSFNRNPTPLISSIPPPSINSPSPTQSRSIPRVKMDLFAVICIETSHFVSFVKCGPDNKAPWVFFDSMADRVENVTTGTGHNIPQVKLLPKMGMWLDELETKHHQEIRKIMETDQFPPELKRLLADPYICLYYSKESCMYG